MWVWFIVLKNEPRVLLCNVLGVYPQGAPNLPGKTPTSGTICYGHISRAVLAADPDGSHLLGLVPERLSAGPLGPNTLNVTNSTYKGCFNSGFRNLNGA